MKRKRDQFFEHLTKQETLESIFKSWAWVLVTAAVFQVSLSTLKSGPVFFGLLCFFVFIILSALLLFYVAKYIALPLENAMKGPLPNSEPPLTWRSVVRQPLRSLLTIPGVVYLALAMGFFIFTSEFVKTIAVRGVTGG
ncbi:MAG: hypothetical protein V4688_00810 [Pseudomonadota bacterium]